MLVKKKSKLIGIHIGHKMLTLPDSPKIWCLDALIHAFIPKLLITKQTEKLANDTIKEIREDVYWERRYESIGMEKAETLLIKENKEFLCVEQYQKDTNTTIICLNTNYPLPFKPAYHLITKKRTPPTGKDTFIGFSHEDTTPIMKKWNDIPSHKCPTIPEKTFKRFIKILLRRAGYHFTEIAKLNAFKNTDSIFTEGVTDPLFNKTYFSHDREQFL